VTGTDVFTQSCHILRINLTIRFSAGKFARYHYSVDYKNLPSMILYSLSGNPLEGRIIEAPLWFGCRYYSNIGLVNNFKNRGVPEVVSVMN